MGDI
jgi:Cdc6-like AAA superfamily ATPase